MSYLSLFVGRNELFLSVRWSLVEGKNEKYCEMLIIKYLINSFSPSRYAGPEGKGQVGRLEREEGHQPGRRYDRIHRQG